MKNKVSKRFLTVAYIYFIIALFFLILHLFQLERFSGTRGDINYIGMSTKKTFASPSKVRKIKMYFNGLEIHLNPINRLKVITNDGISHPLQFEHIEFLDNGMILRFNHDVSLKITSDIHSKKVTIQPDLPLTIPPMERLLIPMNWMDGFSLVFEEDLYKLQGSSEEIFYLTIPPNTVLSQEGKSLDLDVSNSILRDIVLEETLTGSGRTLEDWFEKEGDRDLQTVYNNEIKRFKSDVFLSLKNRMNDEGVLSNPYGDSYFSESAINALLSEALERNIYKGLQEELSIGTAKNRSKLSYESATYLGDIVNQGSSLISSDWRLLTQMRDGLKKQNYPFFDYQDLFLFFNSQNGLVNDLPELEKIARTDSPAMNTSNYQYQINQITFLLDAERNRNDFERKQIILHQLDNLLANIFWIKEDLLLFDEQGIAKMEDSLRLAEMLTDYASELGDPSLVAAGRKMLLSVMNHTDDTGIIPESLIYSSSGEPEKIGIIQPERAYEILQPSLYHPRRISLSDKLGQGSWIYTAVPQFSISNSPRETTMKMDFPVDSAHHMVIRGIKPFNSIYLHGIKWKSDANFQRYSDGWIYDAQRQVLYLKIQHRLPTETVQIRYYSEEPVNPPPAADVTQPENTPQAEETGATVENKN